MTVENFNKTKIKICGLRRREDILAVNEAKPDYCGFIIEFPKSFRSVTADEVRELVNDLSPDIQPVGVFVNAPMELVKALMDEGTLAMAQLHGQENESYITELKAHTDKPVIKAFSIKTADDMENALQSPADYILLDQGSGGTGKTFDWSLIPKFQDVEIRTVRQSHVTEGRISMNKKITEAFAKGKAFIPFVTCGDPSLDVTEKIVYAMEEAGADLIELGIPFSDPTAEGPVIQGANLRALSGGVTTDKVFDMVEKIRKNSSIPMVFMTYANVVFSYGVERFCRKAAEVGMDGMILPDVPFEEKDEFASVAEKYGLDLISLIAPTSHERISMIAKEAEGFVYCVSSLGVTGMRSQITTDIGAMVQLVKMQKDIPCAVGFGISTLEQAKKMTEQADGVIVGSAIVKLCETYGEDCVPYVGEYVKSMKDAIR